MSRSIPTSMPLVVQLVDSMDWRKPRIKNWRNRIGCWRLSIKRLVAVFVKVLVFSVESPLADKEFSSEYESGRPDRYEQGAAGSIPLIVNLCYSILGLGGMVGIYYFR